MKNLYQTMAISAANLLGLTLNTGDTTALKPYFSSSGDANCIQVMSDNEMRGIEAAHLEIYAACKWGHAAFEPVRVESEPLSPEVCDLYDQMMQA